ALPICVVHKISDDEFVVEFPDLPGCTATGRTFTEAERHAADSLRGHLESLMAVGAAVPQPSDLERIKSRRESRGGAVIAIPFAPRDPRGQQRTALLKGVGLLRTYKGGLSGATERRRPRTPYRGRRAPEPRP